MRVRRAALAPLLAAAAGLAGATAAPAATPSRFYVRGAGYGHGVGMSQYGAQGYALHGWRYDAILRHYYSGTTLGRLSPGATVRVLLVAGARTVALTNAAAVGRRRLNPASTYYVYAKGGGLAVRARGARRGAALPASATFTGRGGYLVLGNRAMDGIAGGGFRGALALSRDGGGVDVVNVAGVDSYVRGVVAGEMPSSWEPEALKAQAVAARTYALASGSPLYPDTRSQVYEGMAGETPSTDAAVRATAGQVVLYAGRPAITYFFSTSGGRTEDVRYGFPGAAPRPWLRSVDDPYDNVSPRHRWTLRMSEASAAARLRGLYRGTFRGIKVLERGYSPRIVRARVMGSRGSTVVSGTQLRARFSAYDTWMNFTLISGRRTKPKPKPSSGGSGGSGGVPPGAIGSGLMPERVAIAQEAQLSGRISDTGARARRAVVQRWTGRSWRRVATVTVRRGGYAYRTDRHGRYRIVWAGLPGPAVAL